MQTIHDKLLGQLYHDTIGHDIRGEEQQGLWRVISVYDESVTFDALTAVCSQLQINPLLESLREWYVIFYDYDGKLYSMHKLVRDYGYAQLTPEEARVYHSCAADYYRARPAADDEVRTRNLLKAFSHYISGRQMDQAERQLLEIADALYALGDIDSLRRAIQELENVCGLRPIAPWLQVYKSRVLNLLGKHHDGKQVLEQLSTSNDQRIRVVANNELADVFYYDGDFDQAMAAYAKSRATAEEVDYKEGRSYVLHSQAMIHFYRAEYGEALDLYNKSLALCEEFKDEIGQLEILYKSAAVYTRMGDYHTAKERAQRACGIAEKLRNPSGRSNALHEIAFIELNMGNLATALRWYKAVLEIDRQLGDTIGQAHVMHDIGNVYAEQGDYDEALSQYRQSLEIKKRLGDRVGAAYTLHEMGNLHVARGQNDLALKYYVESFEIKKAFDDLAGCFKTIQAVQRIHGLEEHGQQLVATWGCEDLKSIETALRKALGERLPLIREYLNQREHSMKRHWYYVTRHGDTYVRAETGGTSDQTGG
ncbi:MAG: tetratricopeptide repeat protein [Chloroflexi bacterium]|nr:tetratricopeptide repeat protein [Chloroflexota bacterium]